jgi:hypothetical protein
VNRTWLLVVLGGVVFVVAQGLSAASPRALLEIWGVVEGDEVEIDGEAVMVKGATRRPFAGEAVAGQAAVARELALGKHSIVVPQKGCAPQSFEVDLASATKRSIVIEPPTERCNVPLVPARFEP